ncbi:MAG: ROK family protein [Dehalococcoidia bacterium]|nr:ROK family protein [Dehalococcoidia bacterium]
MVHYILAADFGATNLRAAIATADGEVLARDQAETPAEAPRDQITQTVISLLGRVAAMSPGPVSAASIASAGLIDAEAGKVVVSPSAAGFRDLELTGPVRDALGIPCVIENDASAAALGEFRFGAGRGYRHIVHVTVGTGIGGGLVLNRRLYRGARGFAGEIGHIILDPAGPPCNCGSRGCLEALASGTAFENRARRLLSTGRSTLLADIVGNESPTGEHLYSAARQGDALSEAEIRNAGHYLGLGLGSLVNVLNPELITISGGLLVLGDMYFEPMREALRSLAYGPAAGLEVKFSELSGDTGLLGAVAVALERLEDGDI